MPSFSHDGLVRLFENRPDLAVVLLRDVLGIDVPAHTEARIASSDLTDIEAASRYADLVVLLAGAKPELGIVVEVQLDIDEDKRFAWPVYVTNLRARLQCDVELLVVTPKARVARWAARPIRIGQGSIRPLVLGPGGIPLVTDDAAAVANPELAVLSAMAHARRPVEQIVQTALVAIRAAASLPDRRSLLYFDLITTALSQAARAALEELMRTDNYEFQSEFARTHRAEGRAEGKAEGKAEGRAEGKAEGEAHALLTVLEARGIELTAEQDERVRACRDLAELDRWLRRAATISRADDLFAD